MSVTTTTVDSSHQSPEWKSKTIQVVCCSSAANIWIESWQHMIKGTIVGYSLRMCEDQCIVRESDRGWVSTRQFASTPIWPKQAIRASKPAWRKICQLYMTHHDPITKYSHISHFPLGRPQIRVRVMLWRLVGWWWDPDQLIRHCGYQAKSPNRWE